MSSPIGGSSFFFESDCRRRRFSSKSTPFIFSSVILNLAISAQRLEPHRAPEDEGDDAHREHLRQVLAEERAPVGGVGAIIATAP